MKKLGADHEYVATIINNLGWVLQDLGDLAGAKAAFERALKIDEATYGPDHPNVAIRCQQLGHVLKDLGDLAGAKAAYERALKIDETTLVQIIPMSPSTSTTWAVCCKTWATWRGRKPPSSAP